MESGEVPKHIQDITLDIDSSSSKKYLKLFDLSVFLKLIKNQNGNQITLGIARSDQNRAEGKG